MKKKNITFDEFFEEHYQQRWPKLRAALLKDSQQVIRSTFNNTNIRNNDCIFNYPIYKDEDKGIFTQLDSNQLKKYYIMDPASIICAKSLEISESDFVLDMCAAPGGKTLILLESIKSGQLWCNEISQARRSKLKNVIQEYTPKEMREIVHIKGKDGIRYGLMHPNTFDKILLDAPCSGESHLLHSPKELEKWNIKRTKRLAKTQYALLCSAILACKSKGQILYSTCSISPFENDEVIKRALEKKGDSVELNLPILDLPGIEKTKYGYIFLPDNSQAGPIYFSRLSKK